MALDSVNNITFEHLKHGSLLQPENQNCIMDILAENNISNPLLLQLNNISILPMVMTPCPKVCEPTSMISSFFSNVHNFSYPAHNMVDWPLQNSLLPLQTIPIIVANPSPIFTTLCPYTDNLGPPILSPIIQHYVPEGMPASSYRTDLVYTEPSFCTEIIEDVAFNRHTCYGTEDNICETKANKNVENQRDPFDFYMKLPRELFPPARWLSFDPNVLIDEFCKISNFQTHIPWLLDLEFGIPKAPITRPIPIYNVKINSINCKNAPEAIHPGFESCEPDFKRILLFYYDCIVSAWYRGYVVINYDRSVENFQSWLVFPMQVLGMCWP